MGYGDDLRLFDGNSVYDAGDLWMIFKNPLKDAEKYKVTAEQLWNQEIYDQYSRNYTQVQQKLAHTVGEQLAGRVSLKEDRQSLEGMVKVSTQVYVLTSDELKELLKK